MEFTDNQKSLMDIEIANLRNRFDEMPAYMEQKMLLMQKMGENIHEKMSAQFG